MILLPREAGCLAIIVAISKQYNIILKERNIIKPVQNARG